MMLRRALLCLPLVVLAFSGCKKENHVTVENHGPKARKPRTCDAAGKTAPGTDGRDMALVPLGAGSTCFWMDDEEVSVGAYVQFVAASPASQIDGCDWNTSYAPDATCEAAGSDTDPARCVDWCDAAEYCAWAGKRLCGGPTRDSSTSNDPDSSEWFDACADQAALRSYPYATSYDKNACNGQQHGTGGPVATGSLSSCESPEHVSDLSGNVAEWTDECDGDGQKDDTCLTRGGSFASDGNGLRCDRAVPLSRDHASAMVGFRCCAD